VHGTTPVQAHAASGELVDDVPGVGDGAGEPVELGDHEGAAGSAGGEGLAQAGALAVSAGDAGDAVDPVGLHAEGGEGLALGGQVLPIGADPGVADLDCGHGRSIAGCPTLTGHLCGRVVRERRRRSRSGLGWGSGVFPYGVRLPKQEGVGGRTGHLRCAG